MKSKFKIGDRITCTYSIEEIPIVALGTYVILDIEIHWKDTMMLRLEEFPGWLFQDTMFEPISPVKISVKKKKENLDIWEKYAN